jgi:hypothetical protein
MYRENK